VHPAVPNFPCPTMGWQIEILFFYMTF